IKTFSREYLRLRRDTEKGRQTFLDAYGATNEAEFFAVATEHFFEQPLIMEKNVPELYRRLREYYGQDPASRFRQTNRSV
ncbi:MAG TPA: zinc-dependent peptidase, partial [Smithella sp.]|nr:zinc-dependent peptidase [Smithella sp.]